MHQILFIVAMLATAFLTGVELSIALFVHPVLWHIDDAAHAQAAKALARVLGRFMPFWYAAATALAIGVVLTRPTGTIAWWASLSAASLLAGSIVFTLVGPVPINNRVAAWRLDALPADWKRDRRMWDRLHSIRTVALAVASALLAIAATR